MQTDLTTEVIKTVFAVATPIIVGLVTTLLVKALQKANLSISADNQAKLEHLAEQAILATEEWAAARIKAKLPTFSSDKLAQAVTTLTAKVPGITVDEAADLIHATLPQVRGATVTFLQGLQSAATTGASQ